MDEEIKKLLEKNLELNTEIHEMVKSIKNYVVWARIFSILKILIILVPIILGIIYLPALLGNAFGQYKELLGGGAGADINSLSPDLLKLIK